MQSSVFFLLFLLPMYLWGAEYSKPPQVNPEWQEIYLYSTDNYSILYDCETNSVLYKFHMWLPWEMTHSPWCFCHGTDFEIDDATHAAEYEAEELKYLVEPGLRAPGNPVL